MQLSASKRDEEIKNEVETNAAHILEVSLKMACYVRPKYVAELINK